MTTSTITAARLPRAARFWDRIADRYAAKPVPDAAVYEEKLRIIRSHLTPESSVFEFGCGTGSTALALAPFAGTVLASDLSPRMIAIGARKAVDAGIANLEFRRAAVEDMTLGDESIDVVLGMSILHLLEDRGTALDSVYRMLKPGGVFISSTACIGEKMGFFRLVAPLLNVLRLIPTIKVFTADALEGELAARGFAIERNWRPGDGTTAFIVARKSA